jgi:hypothetical protein
MHLYNLLKEFIIIPPVIYEFTDKSTGKKDLILVLLL